MCNNAFANAIAMKCQLECESKSESGNIYRLLSPAKQAANVKMQVSCLKVQAAASVKVQSGTIVKVKVQAAANVKVG